MKESEEQDTSELEEVMEGDLAPDQGLDWLWPEEALALVWRASGQGRFYSLPLHQLQHSPLHGDPF